MKKLFSFFCCILMTLAAGSAGASQPGAKVPRYAVSAVKPQKALTSAAVADVTNNIAVTGYFRNQTGQGLTASDLANALVGQGVQISNVTSNCADNAAGGFLVNGDVGIGLSSGILLSTGSIANVVGPNVSDETSMENGMVGDPDLEALIPGYSTYDACVLEFDFVPQSPTVSFRYAFSSEEYNEYVGSEYNDVFGFFINGVNCAKINDSVISINSVNASSNNAYYVNNDTGAYNIEMDGFTRVMTCSAAVQVGQTNHLKLAIADAGDPIYDSNVFIGTQSLVSEPYGVSLTPDTLSGSAACGTVAIYELDLQNLGSAGDSFNLTLTNGHWPFTFTGTGTTAMTVGPLASLATAKVTITVPIPSGECTGSDEVTVTATSVASPSKTAVSTLSIMAQPLTRRLTVITAGTGAGAVVSTPEGIICTGGTCTADYAPATEVTLMQVSDSDSTFAGWSGACTNTSGDCVVTLDSDIVVTATFNLTPLAMIGATPYSTLQSAYNAAAASGEVIMLKEGNPGSALGTLTADAEKSVTVKGGYDAAFSSSSGSTDILGPITISSGMVSIDKVGVR